MNLAMLITPGAFEPTWPKAGTLSVGVLLTACSGEIVRRIRIRQADFFRRFGHID